MSRGGLLLRCVTADVELPYVPLRGAVRHGARPPRLPRTSSVEKAAVPAACVTSADQVVPTTAFVAVSRSSFGGEVLL